MKNPGFRPPRRTKKLPSSSTSCIREEIVFDKVILDLGSTEHPRTILDENIIIILNHRRAQNKSFKALEICSEEPVFLRKKMKNSGFHPPQRTEKCPSSLSPYSREKIVSRKGVTFDKVIFDLDSAEHPRSNSIHWRADFWLISDSAPNGLVHQRPLPGALGRSAIQRPGRCRPGRWYHRL
ncbi:hypothetical protein CEXT_659461 [Caerostris extrusa]|uniref:Uncharacterized protein n=1 Tax=Caerostris extrusa TaxID=172846 RepID=A0AAV4M553_CAEEX|nr:hypothetical protein CEXT_659461 [Caerostris extrusa]